MIKIALLGDSMVDTLFFGGKFWDLEILLKEKYPNKKFKLLNHGVGVTDAKIGLYRLTHDYDYKERNRHLPALISEKADMIIVESFAYNHGPNTNKGIKDYKETISTIINTLKGETESELFLYAPISPNKHIYTKGISWLGWSEAERAKEYKATRVYLEEFIRLAKVIRLPLINTYNKSLDGDDGNVEYISNVDGIHFSSVGRQLVAKEMLTMLKY